MGEHNCETCSFRAKYDKKPDSVLGKIWRWHTGWCPGWKKYMISLDDEKRLELVQKYGMEKFR